VLTCSSQSSAIRWWLAKVPRTSPVTLSPSPSDSENSENLSMDEPAWSPPVSMPAMNRPILDWGNACAMPAASFRAAATWCAADAEIMSPT
jgi:hypothetical protein